jgi:hypothetical protein
VKSNKYLIPGIVADEGTSLVLTNTEIIGNLNHDTIGVLTKWADIKMTNCFINNHQNGGIQIQSH